MSDLKTLYTVKYRDLSGGDRLNQHCVNSFGKGLNVTDIHLYVKVPHCRFNLVTVQSLVTEVLMAPVMFYAQITSTDVSNTL